MTGARTTPSAYTPSAWPCLAGGKLSSRIACDSGCSAPPPAPWIARASRINGSVGAIPHTNDATVNTASELIRYFLRPKRCAK